MDYYILKMYELEKKKHNIKLGYNRFSKKEKKVIYSMFVIMFLSLFLAIIISFFVKAFYVPFLVSTVPAIIALFVIYHVDKTNENHAYKANVKEHIKKITILYNEVLKGEDINITTEKQIRELINKYNKYIGEQENKNNKKSKMIATLASACYMVLTLILQYMKGSDVQVIDWIWVAIITTLVFVVVASSIHLSKYLDKLQYSYKKIVDDLEDIIVLYFT